MESSVKCGKGMGDRALQNRPSPDSSHHCVCKSESESEHQGTSPRALSLRCVGRSSCKNSGRVGGVALGCTTLQCLVNREYILPKSPLVSSRRTRPRAKTWPHVEHFHMLGWRLWVVMQSRKGM